MKIMKISHEVYNVELQPNPGSLVSRLYSQYKFGKHLNKMIAIASLGVIGLLTSSCAPAYVETVPSETVYVRPIRPNDQYIWIDGNWVWNNRTGRYVQRNGYWDRPRYNHTYTQGYWRATPRGHQWQQGHWQRNGRSGGNRHR
ncbi:YXWGXW repeat-containing protein [Williamwhitmania taraxaci]|nr:YXWGXW repeat-containing protein [Williamwhitmania taraxaci]